MQEYIDTLKKSGFKGDIINDDASKAFYSHDASIFEIKPELVVAPKDADDVKILVKNTADYKEVLPNISLTARSAGTCMSGGAINDSVVVDFNKYMNVIGEVSSDEANVQPGAFYRDFEKKTLETGMIMPSYPASREICTVGGMVANNAGGEKSLEFGKVEKFVQELKVVFSDGLEYVVKPLNKKELDAKMSQGDYEGDIYRKVFELVDGKYDEIKAAKPKVTKDSTGYHLWNVWDRESGIFDLTQLIVGSQGTLGLVTDIKFRLVKNPKHTGTLVIFLRKLDDLGELINDVLKKNPATFEGFDNYTLMLSLKLFMYFRKTLGWMGLVKLAFQLIPDALILFRDIPKMVLLVQFSGDDKADVAKKVHEMRLALKDYKHESLFEEDETESKEKKFWIMRRESFNILRHKVKDKHTAPFIDDLVVNPEHLPQFLPEIRSVLNKYKFLATVAGHMGDGNFHIIPLMNLEDEKERALLEPAMKEINGIVLKYGGSLSGEHNDGLSRGPWLEQMYGPQVVEIFKQLKNIFDPNNMFNPHKKTDATWDYSFSHIRTKF
jgi:FAD/FMN-containing dehydrogenase